MTGSETLYPGNLESWDVVKWTPRRVHPRRAVSTGNQSHKTYEVSPSLVRPAPSSSSISHDAPLLENVTLSRKRAPPTTSNWSPEFPAPYSISAYAKEPLAHLFMGIKSCLSTSIKAILNDSAGVGRN